MTAQVVACSSHLCYDVDLVSRGHLPPLRPYSYTRSPSQHAVKEEQIREEEDETATE
jgi:hypothetical protein